MASATMRDILLGVLDRRIGEAKLMADARMAESRWQDVAYWKAAEDQLRQARIELCSIFPKNGC